ncbi:MAG: phenylalanine--tRNA ligase subunit alpha [Flavobacteriales bacterium]|nr:phenylalanine--tRNA ligase subunit alpha [Flavobacteriales bacterium]MCB9449535.1 phenylalanine--tRNA ligase subunit alpha [Flavobacteriales bacterium]
MLEEVKKFVKEIESVQVSTTEALESFRLEWLSRKGKVQSLFARFREAPSDIKRQLGQELNQLKQLAQEKFDEAAGRLTQSGGASEFSMDLTLPGEGIMLGSRHPLSLVRNEIIDIFNRIGFVVSDGPEIESDWNNFSALNMPEDHPARDMQDTFFMHKDPDVVLRTHTSSVQVRVMNNQHPPIRTISPGRVYRNEAISARAHCLFHQVEGLCIDEHASFADLKQVLEFFATEMFGAKTKIRLRPSFFPFTEPSAEMDISCNICGGEGCNICKHSGWVEILGCGMVDPAVLNNCGIDSEKYTGYAFGMGIERIAILKHRVNDIRLFFENDIRFINQFTSSF